ADPVAWHVEAGGGARREAVPDEIGTALPPRARHAQPAAGGRTPALHPHARDAAEQVAEGPGSGSSDLLLGEEVAPPSRAATLEIPPPLLREARATLDRHRVEQNGKPL